MAKRIFLNPPKPSCAPSSGCPVVLPGTCVYYSGSPTSCLGILTNTPFNEIVKLLDQAICNITSGGSGTVTSVNASIGGALSVTGGPVTTTGSLDFSWTGNSNQYVKGDGTLGTLPSSNIYTADNALEMTSNNIQLGGEMIKNTDIYATSTVYFSMYDVAGYSFSTSTEPTDGTSGKFYTDWYETYMDHDAITDLARVVVSADPALLSTSVRAFAQGTGEAHVIEIQKTSIKIGRDIGQPINTHIEIGDSGIQTDLYIYTLPDISADKILYVNSTTGKITMGNAPGGGGSSSRLYNQSLTGTQDGTNTVFTTGSNFVSNSTALYINGLRQTLGSSYTETGANQITFSEAPQSTDEIFIDYNF